MAKNNYIVDVKIQFNTVTDVMANDVDEAGDMILEQLQNKFEQELMKFLNKYPIKDGTKSGNNLNDIREFEVKLGYVEPQDTDEEVVYGEDETPV